MFRDTATGYITSQVAHTAANNKHIYIYNGTGKLATAAVKDADNEDDPRGANFKPHSRHIFTSDKGGGKCVCPCLSVCLLARLLKNACMDLDEMLCVDRCRDMDELINFEPDPDYSPDAGTGLLSPISYKR